MGAVEPMIADSPAAASRSSREGHRAQRTALHYFEAYALVILLVLVAAFFGLWSKTSGTFLTAANLQAVIGNQSVTAIIALAALIPLVCNEWDLSVGAVAGLAAVIAASVLSGGTSIVVALGAAVLSGLAVGIVNGTIVTRLGVNGVITTLGMGTILAGVVNQKTGGTAVVSNIPVSLTNFGANNWIGIPKVGFVLVAAALLVYYLLEHTPFGRYLYALGANPAAAKLVGLRTKLLLFSAFVLAAALAAAGGFLQVARAGGADPRLGDGFTLPALAAAFLSAASISPGRYNVGGTIVAVFFLATLNSGLNLAGSPPYVASYVNGLALIVGVALAAYLGRKRSGAAD